MVKEIDIIKSKKPDKKYDAIIYREDGRTKTVSFGQSGASDYTIHKDKDRMMRYIARHRANEDWSSEGYETAGWFSRWILWNLPSLRASVADTNKRFRKMNKKLRL